MIETREMVGDVRTFTGQARDGLMDVLEACGPLRVNLGCGNDYIEGWCNVDYGEGVRKDKNINLDGAYLRLPWDDNKVDVIVAFHILEHIQRIQALKREMARILRPDGILMVLVPNYLSLDAWGDDTHCRAFSIHSFFNQYWPGMETRYVETVPVTDGLGNNNEWLLATIRGK